MRTHDLGSGRLEFGSRGARDLTEAGVPVPDVLLIDTIEGEGQNLETMVLADVRGQKLSTVIGVARRERRDPGLERSWQDLASDS